MSPRVSIGGDGENSARLSVLVIVVGVAIAGYGGYDHVQQSDAVSNAVEVEATITGTDIEASASRRGGTEYRPAVSFEYSYQGATYTGDRIYPANTESNLDTRSAARSVLEEYQTGETVTAYVDPDSPATGFLKAETSNAPLKVMGFGALFAFLGVISLVRS
ncbi:DUF3592 domain-containing protein [Halosimplex sp. TS25]|uniref:DUF3592 domain-containing protein n=1 Tax=Halosimplex rarum TaxID=3396619 RepID=UPI0039EA2226